MTISFETPVAEIDRRFHAFAVDRALAWTLYAVAGAAAWLWFLRDDRLLPGIFVLVLGLALVNLLFLVPLAARGVSPGKALLGLRVVDARDGTPIGPRRALVRSLILGAGSLPTLGLGAATLAWTAVEDRTRARRGWHDHVVRSTVVDVRPRPVAPAVEDEGPRHVANLTAMRLMQVRQPEMPVVPAPVPAVAPPVARSGAPAAAWRISFDTGQVIDVDGLVLVGRRPTAGPGEAVRHAVPLTSKNMSISKTHAQLHVAPDGALVVTDRGSTNGSILVRQGVSRDLAPGRPATLLDGDRVIIGDREMHVSRGTQE